MNPCSGGHYAPAIAKLLQTRAHGYGVLPVTVDTVGIVSGFIDFLVQGEYFPSFAINNTYGIQAYDLEVAASAAYNWSAPGGCVEQVEACHALTPNGYRDQYGTNDTVVEVCGAAFTWCWANVYGAYEAFSGVSQCESRCQWHLCTREPTDFVLCSAIPLILPFSTHPRSRRPMRMVSCRRTGS